MTEATLERVATPLLHWRVQLCLVGLPSGLPPIRRRRRIPTVRRRSPLGDQHRLGALRAGRAHRLAPPLDRPDAVRHRRRRARSIPRREPIVPSTPVTSSTHPWGRMALARRRARPLHDSPVDERRRRRVGPAPQRQRIRRTGVRGGATACKSCWKEDQPCIARGPASTGLRRAVRGGSGRSSTTSSRYAARPARTWLLSWPRQRNRPGRRPTCALFSRISMKRSRCGDRLDLAGTRGLWFAHWGSTPGRSPRTRAAPLVDLQCLV